MRYRGGDHYGLGYPGYGTTPAPDVEGCRVVRVGDGEILVEPGESDMLRREGGGVIAAAGVAFGDETIGTAVAAAAAEANASE